MAFHVVSSFLLRVLASKTTFWMAWIFQQPIRCFYFMVSGANTRIKKEDTTWKAMKSWARKCYNFLCTINFEVTWPFWKMWTNVSNPVSYIKINCSDTISDSDCQIGLVCWCGFRFNNSGIGHCYIISSLGLKKAAITRFVIQWARS